MSLMLTRLGEKPAKKERVSLAPTELRPAKEQAYRNYLWTIEQEPKLAGQIDRKVFEWLQAREDRPHKLPPLFATFQTYLTDARLFYDTRKRVLRRREVEPEAGEE